MKYKKIQGFKGKKWITKIPFFKNFTRCKVLTNVNIFICFVVDDEVPDLHLNLFLSVLITFQLWFSDIFQANISPFIWNYITIFVGIYHKKTYWRMVKKLSTIINNNKVNNRYDDDYSKFVLILSFDWLFSYWFVLFLLILQPI